MIQVGQLVARYGGDTSDFDRAADHVRGQMRNIGGEFEGMGVKGIAMGVALGQGIVNAISGVAGAVGGLLSSSVGNVSSYERNLSTLKSLIGTEILQANARTETVRVGAQVTAETLKSSRAYQELADKLAIAKAKYDDMARSRQYWPNDPVKQSLNQAELNQRQRAYQDLQAKMDAMTGAIGKYQTETRAILPTEEERNAAWAQAAVKAQELAGWITKLAIESPFNEADVMTVVRMGKAFGFNVAEIEKMTPVILDMAAASGQSSHAVGEIGYIIGQIKGTGKVLTQDIRQLATRGVPLLNETLAQFGASIGTIGKANIQSDEFIKALMANWQTYFSGAAKGLASSFSGLMTSFEDLKIVAQRDLFGPAFERARPALEKVVELLQRPEMKTTLKVLGEGLGEIASGPLKLFTGALEAVAGPMKVFATTLELTKNPGLALKNTLRTMLPPEVARPLLLTLGAIERLPMLFDGGANAAQRFGLSFGAVFGEDEGKKLQDFALTVQDFAGKIGGSLARTFGVQLNFTPSGWPDAAKLAADIAKKAGEWWDTTAVPALKGAAGGAAGLIARTLGVQLDFTPDGWPDVTKFAADLRAKVDAWWAAQVAPKLVDEKGAAKPFSLQMAIDVSGAVFTGLDNIGARFLTAVAEANVPAQLGAAFGTMLGTAAAAIPKALTEGDKLKPAKEASFNAGKVFVNAILPQFVAGVGAGIAEGWKNVMGQIDFGTFLRNLSGRVFFGTALDAPPDPRAKQDLGEAIRKALGITGEPEPAEAERLLSDAVRMYDPVTNAAAMGRFVSDIAHNIEAGLMGMAPVPVRVPWKTYTPVMTTTGPTSTTGPVGPIAPPASWGAGGVGWPSYGGGDIPVLGNMTTSGVAAGIAAGQGDLDAAMRASMLSMVQAGRDALEAKSPSMRTYRDIGQPAWQGVDMALRDGRPLVNASWQALVMDGFVTLTNDNTSNLYYQAGSMFAIRVSEGFQSEAGRVRKVFLDAVDSAIGQVVARILGEVKRQLR